ncbi:MAG: competence/damage-inducible protein A [Clostridia bacterium]
MIAEIVSVGTELLLGQIVNGDAQYLSRRLSEAGITVYYHVTVGDNPARLRDTLQTALSRADIVITTGGLGPTADDLTKETAAALLGLPMERDTESARRIGEYFAKIGRSMTENNLKQADFARGAMILPNTCGTAPGCIVEKGAQCVIQLPGPPTELEAMVDLSVMPYLEARSGQRIVSRYLRIFGMGESEVETRLRDIMVASVNPTLAPYCSTGEVQLRMTVRCARDTDAETLLQPMMQTVRQRLGDVIYAVFDTPQEAMEHAVAACLSACGATLAVAESCTGGLLSAQLVNVPGISGALREAHVTYANEAKIRVLGVRAQTLETFGAVSAETAREMAEGARRRAGTDYALSTTGIAGPGGGTAEKPVGLVYVGLATPQGTETLCLHLRGNRQKIRILTCLHAMYALLRALQAS